MIIPISYKYLAGWDHIQGNNGQKYKYNKHKLLFNMISLLQQYLIVINKKYYIAFP